MYDLPAVCEALVETLGRHAPKWETIVVRAVDNVTARRAMHRRSWRNLDLERSAVLVSAPDDVQSYVLAREWKAPGRSSQEGVKPRLAPDRKCACISWRRTLSSAGESSN